MKIIRALFVFAGRSDEFSRSNLYVHGYVFSFWSRVISFFVAR